jgi:biotin transport system substrate-specific component
MQGGVMKAETAVLIKKENVMVQMVSIGAWAFLMAVSAAVKIPLFFTPVPITLQTLVLFSSILFLKQRAVYAQFLYILLGTLGLPVFSSGASMVALTGPSGGYLFGFCLFALVVPHLLPTMGSSRFSFFKIFALFLGANFLFVYACGIIWLHYVYMFSWQQGVLLGAFPFIIGDVLKIAAVSTLAVRIRSRR